MSRLTHVPWWVTVLAVYLLSRAVTFLFLAILESTNGFTAVPGKTLDYFGFAGQWDGKWYEVIAYDGYPAELPRARDGAVTENAWAFMPVFPFLVRGFVVVTGLPFDVTGAVLSLMVGACAALMVFRLLRTALDQATSLFAVLLFCVAPISPLFHMVYAESLYFLLLAAALFLLVKRNYGWLFPLVAVMALTRPSGLAFALTVGLHAIYRFVVRARDSFSFRERWTCVALAGFSCMAGFAWPTIAALVTGSLTAYTDTELAWRAGYIGSHPLRPFTSWFEGAHWWLTTYLRMPDWVGPAVVVLLMALFALLLVMPGARRLGVDMRLWCASYGLYLLAVFFPQSSTFRLLGPLFPLWGVVAQGRNIVFRVALVVACLAAQWGWIVVCWHIMVGDWTPP